MKKIFSIITIFLSIFSAVNTQKCYAETNFYAKIETTGVYFYSAPNENSSLFEIPYSYFVKVEEVVDTFYKATYQGTSGYVKKSEVTLMNGEPQRPYANATFKVFVSNYLYSSATQSSPTVIDISSSSTLTYFGTKSGQQLSSSSQIWYYASVEKDGQVYFGYVFSGITDYLTNIGINNETFEIANSETLSPTPQNTETTLSNKTKILLIISISLPSVLILYFLIKPGKIQITRTKKQIKKQKKIHHGDYFEFDENDI